MTESTKIAIVKNMTDETDADVISAFLELAGDAIYHYADPYSQSDKSTLLENYGGVQTRAAAYFLNKRGADGESGRSENRTSISYESADLPGSLLREITPICGVIV